MERFNARMRGEAIPARQVFRIVKKDGSVLIVEFTSAPFLKDGKAAGVQGIGRDITENTGVADALRESEEKYKTIVENSLAGIYLIQDGKYQFLNPRFIEMSGYTEEELIGKTDPLELTHPDDRERVADLMRRRLKGELAPAEYEMRGIRKDGTIVSLKVLSDRVMYRGRPAVMGTILDMTEQKEIEDRYRNLLENALEGVYQSTPDGRLMMANRALAQMLGFESEADLVALPNTAMLYDDPSERAEFAKRLDRDGFVSNAELHLKRRDGSDIYVEESARVVRGPSGEVRYYEGIIQDITERKRSAERMRGIYEVATSLTGETQDVLDQLVASIADTFKTKYALVGEVSGDTVKVRAHHPPGIEWITDYELRGTPCEGVMQSGQSCRYCDGVTALFPEDLGAQQLKIRSYLGCPLFDSHHKVTGIACVFDPSPQSFSEADEQLLRIYAQRAASELERAHETAEKEKVRLQLMQAQKMESIGTLAGGIAHDFNNLLTVVLGYASLMLSEIDGSHPWYDQLRQIEKTAQRGSQLTSQMLAFSRRAITQPTDVNPNVLVDETAGMLERSLDPSIQIECRLDPSVWTIRADHTQVQHVLMNLCVNARDAMDAMPDGGVLTIGTQNVRLDEEAASEIPDAQAGRYVVLSVQDTGTGIEPKIVGRIFEPFFTTKEVGKGTGLGLSMVYGIVRTHGGYVNVSSEPGKGTRFDVGFPALFETSEGAELAALRGTESLLLVDHDTLVLELGKAVLERFGYRVTTARNGEEAVARIMQPGQDISLAIVDLSVPGMGGFECVKELRKQRPALKAVLACESGEVCKAPETHDGDLGEIRFVQKPYRIHDLVHAVRESLRS